MRAKRVRLLGACGLLLGSTLFAAAFNPIRQIAPVWSNNSAPTDPSWSWAASAQEEALRVEVRSDGTSFAPGAGGNWAWRIALRAPALGAPWVAADRLNLLRAGSVTEMLTTGTDGVLWRLRLEAPATPVELQMSGPLRVRIGAAGDALEFIGTDGAVAFLLSEIKAEDAVGRAIPVQLSVEPPTAEGLRWIATFSLDEGGAIFPVFLEGRYSISALAPDAGCEGCSTKEPLAPCDVDMDGYQSPTCGGLDCNDNNATINPGAPEVPADGIDQDCNGGDMCYTDVDNDNYGTSTLIASVDLDCIDANEGPQPGDCNDTNAAIHPGAAEIPGDGIDQDCNGGDTCYTDVDNDNFGTNPLILSADLDCFDLNEAPVSGDCNDNNPAVNPAAAEIPGDGVDQNCNAQELCYTDVDNDNYGTSTLIVSVDLDCIDANEGPQPGDCNDGNSSIYPGAPEIPGDAIDQDCNGGDTCYTDVDNDNYGTSTLIVSVDLDCIDANEGPQPGDCNDGNSSIYPGAPEIPGDAIDQDCNGGDTCYTDVDNDNYGTNPLISSIDLDCMDLNEAPQPGDCNDGNSSIYPGAPEIPGDAIDQDCNGGDMCYTDVDNDGFGTTPLISSTDLDCNDFNEAPKPGDCNDTNPTIFPTATEVCNGLDDDCDTVPDDGFVAPTGSPLLTLKDLGGTNAQLNWTVVVPSTASDVVMGNLNTLLSSAGNFTSSTTFCLANDTGTTSVTEGSAPSAGAGLWYLVRPMNCQAAGTYDSLSPSQQGLRDAEIAAAGPACP